MGAVTKAPPVLARVYRGPARGIGAPRHPWPSSTSGAAAAACGDAGLPVYARSAAKPFQAMPLLLAGGEKRFRLGDAEIALMCASHGGEPRHVRLARELLKRGGFRAEDLQCGAHAPMHEASARELVRRREEPTALHNNCSGKHAGLLLACRALELAARRVHGRGSSAPAAHPDAARALRRHSRVADQRGRGRLQPSGLPPAALGTRLAYARLVAGRLPGEEPRAAAVRARIVRAMARRPDMVAGTGRFTTDFTDAPDAGGGSARRARRASMPSALLAATGRGARPRPRVQDRGRLGPPPRRGHARRSLERLGVLPVEVRRALASVCRAARAQRARASRSGRIEADVRRSGPRGADAGER